MKELSYHFGKLKLGKWHIYQIQNGKRITIFIGKYKDVWYQWKIMNENTMKDNL